MEEKQCSQCLKPFSPERSRSKFCSQQCSADSQRKTAYQQVFEPGKYSVEGDCWIWTGFKTWEGYPRTGAANKGLSQYAHVAAYTLTIGPVPEGLQLDHLCKNRSCINPRHMEPVTPVVNSSRAKWATSTHCIHGHEFTECNTHHYIQKRNGRPARRCKACHAIESHSRYLRQKAAAAIAG